MNNFVRPRNGAVIAGVCAAIGNRFGVSANIIRLITVVSIVFVGAPVIVYPILWVLIPKEV